jgi:hypothetical protein
VGWLCACGGLGSRTVGHGASVANLSPVGWAVRVSLAGAKRNLPALSRAP